jgi:hypothetical protein
VGGGSCPQSPQIDPLSRLSGLDVHANVLDSFL